MDTRTIVGWGIVLSSLAGCGTKANPGGERPRNSATPSALEKTLDSAPTSSATTATRSAPESTVPIANENDANNESTLRSVVATEAETKSMPMSGGIRGKGGNLILPDPTSDPLDETTQDGPVLKVHQMGLRVD